MREVRGGICSSFIAGVWRIRTFVERTGPQAPKNLVCAATQAEATNSVSRRIFVPPTSPCESPRDDRSGGSGICYQCSRPLAFVQHWKGWVHGGCKVH